MKKEVLKIKLSKQNYEAFRERAARVGLLPDELVENFVQDLIYGENSNGEIEAFCINQWYDRFWFGMEPENMFLAYLLQNYKIDEFYKWHQLRNYNRLLVAAPEPSDREKENYRRDLQEAEQNLNSLWRGFLANGLCDLDQEEEFEKVMRHKNHLQRQR